jgi:hypothetical protein
MEKYTAAAAVGWAQDTMAVLAQRQQRMRNAAEGAKWEELQADVLAGCFK